MTARTMQPTTQTQEKNLVDRFVSYLESECDELRKKLQEAETEIHSLREENIMLKAASAKPSTKRTKSSPTPAGTPSRPGHSSNRLAARKFRPPTSDNEASDYESSHVSHDEDEDETSVGPSPSRTVGSKSKREDTTSKHEPPQKKAKVRLPTLQEFFEHLVRMSNLQPNTHISVGTKENNTPSLVLSVQPVKGGRALYRLMDNDPSDPVESRKLYRSAKEAVEAYTEGPLDAETESNPYKRLLLHTDKGTDDLWSYYQKWVAKTEAKSRAQPTVQEVPKLQVTPPARRPSSPSHSPTPSPMKKAPVTSSSTKPAVNPLAKSDESDNEDETTFQGQD